MDRCQFAHRSKMFRSRNLSLIREKEERRELRVGSCQLTPRYTIKVKKRNKRIPPNSGLRFFNQRLLLAPILIFPTHFHANQRTEYIVSRIVNINRTHLCHIFAYFWCLTCFWFSGLDSKTFVGEKSFLLPTSRLFKL